ncbi:M14 family zinc carboxypeptidase [Virgibacillus oceani]
MGKQMLQKVITIFMILLLVATMSSFTGQALADESVEVPTTGFEDRNGESWTSHEEEMAFLEEVAKLSDRVTYTEIGKSVVDRPLYLVKVGYPEPFSNKEISEGRNMLVIGSQHGNEQAPREMALKMLRDLAFTDDPEQVDLLSQATIMFIPTANPDGIEMDQRRNAEGVDINRDHLNLVTPEIQAIAGVMEQYKPDITVDGHERPSGLNPDMEMQWPRSLNTDTELRELSEEMVQNYLRPDVEEAGFTTGLYGGHTHSTLGLETVLSQMTGLRHGIGLLTESGGAAEPEYRVAAQMETVKSTLRFYHERFDDIGEVVTEAPDRKKDEGETQSEPFYLDGADRREPDESDILDPPPCGYLLHTSQAEQLGQHIDLFSLEIEQVSEDGVFITMGQPMMTVVPYLLDERASHNEVNGLALYDCSDPGSVEPPEPPEQTDPAQYATDFTEDEFGGPPVQWSSMWRESRWTVLDDPRRVEHVVLGSDGGSKGLTWDNVDEVHGDVEVSGVVRANYHPSTLFQIGFHFTGEEGSENGYYVDLRTSDSVRINSWQEGNFTQHSSQSVPFTAMEDTWYQVVLQREGNVMRAKVWPYDEEEPEAFQVTATDNSYNHGRVGMVHFSGGTINEWAFFGVGTGGEDAPRAPDDLFEPDPEVDKTKLQNRVDEINDENLNEKDYTEESWQEFQDALNQANDLLNYSEATQAEVDAALNFLNEARHELERIIPISAAEIKVIVEHFKEEGAFADEEYARVLTLHLTAVSHYEVQDEAEKVIKHMESFKDLLDHQLDNEWISDKAYNKLMSLADELIWKWQSNL